MTKEDYMKLSKEDAFAWSVKENIEFAIEGKYYVCLKDVLRINCEEYRTGKPARKLFIKGKIYLCKNSGYLIDELDEERSVFGYLLKSFRLATVKELHKEKE